MENVLNGLTYDLFLKQSELYKEEYTSANLTQVNALNDLSVTNLDEWFNSILIKFPFLNEVQVNNFNLFLEKLNFILTVIDPNKLKINDDSVEEADLLLWRESTKGISKLFFDEFGQIIFTFNGNDGRKQKGVFNSEVDMEKLLYRFISM